MRNTSLKILGSFSLALAVLFVVPQRASADDDDPPGRVARLSQTSGSVSFNPAGTDDWVDAVINRPLTTGDRLWADKDSRAELRIGSASLRISSNTGFSFLNLSDDTAQIQITEGTLRIRVKRLEENEIFEVDTPNLAFNILKPGTYKINVNEAGDATIIQVRDGEGDVTGGGSTYTVHSDETGTFSGTDQLTADIQGGGYDDDDFDRWCADRDRHEDQSVSARYVPDEVIGYDDLDDYGGWRPVPEYGTVWFPHVTIVGWAPYRYGHWVWISPWGWTWVDDAPWGFAPFHYGRWVTVGGVWGWIPGPRPVVGVAYVRPVYAPALVAWVGGPHFSVGVSVGAGPVGWFPLGPREVFVPSYHVSERYVTRVNITNTTVTNVVVHNYYNNVIVNRNVTVTNVTYINRGAVTATSGKVFVSAQPVGRNIVRVDQRDVERATVVATTPGMAPDHRSVLGAGNESRFRPSARMQNRTVVAKTAPPPPPASFARQQQAIQANGGRPIALSDSRRLATSDANVQPRSNIRIAQPGRRVEPQNARNNPSGNPNSPQGQQQVNPNRPAQPNQAPAQSANPGNQGNRRDFRDRPPSSRTGSAAQSNPQVDQRQQQQMEQLRQKQDLERQKVEQQQQEQQRKITQQRADEQKQQQTRQKQQQQLEQLERKHDQEQQKLQQKQQQERARQTNRPPPKEKKEKPPKDDKPHR